MFIQLSIIFLVTLLFALICKKFNIPLIVGYIIAGILVGNFLVNFHEIKDFITTLAEIGVALMLFIVGIELKLKSLREIGRLSVVIGALQEILTILAGIIFAYMIGFNLLESIYLGIALSFSSTILMVKLISDKGDLEKFYGRLAIGFLLVQDLITILIIITLPFFSFTEIATSPFKFLLALFLILFIPLISYKFLPKFENFLSESSETLFIFSIASALFIASIFRQLGVGLEIGALIAGVSLSALRINTEIASRLRPVRDFFLILFFVYLGFHVSLARLDEILFKGILLSLFVIIVNPLIMFLLVRKLRITTKSAFLLSLTSGLISEFSFILIGLGIKYGHIESSLYEVVSLVGLITFLVSTYLFSKAEDLYIRIKKYLPQKELPEIVSSNLQKSSEIILFGCDRIGYNFLRLFHRLNKNFVIVDYNLEKVKSLERLGFNVIYGDASEAEFLANFDFSSVQMIVSTIPEFQTNLLILREYRRINPSGIFISTAYTINDALELYDNNADYVITPHFLGGEHASHIVEEFMFNKENYLKIKDSEIRKLYERAELGHSHP